MTDNHQTLRHIAGVLRGTQAIALTAMCIAAVVLWSQAGELEHADAWVEHSHDVLATVNGIRADSLRAGMWLRNLAIEPDVGSRRETRTACDLALAGADRLQRLVVETPAQRARAGIVAAEVRKSVGWVRDAVDIDEASGSDTLARVMRMRIGRDSTRGLRVALDDMQAWETQLLHQRFQRQSERLVWIKGLAAAFTAGLLGFLAWSLHYSGRLMRSSHRQIASLAAGSLNDPLTGLLNRRALYEQVDELPPSMPFAVIAFDLDDFKPVNDVHGHAAGDAVLRCVADRLREQCRGQDILARVGGDEFVVVLVGIAEPTRAQFIVSRLRLAIGAPIAIEGGSVQISASLGLAIRGVDGHSFDELVRASDARSYQVKRETKSRTAVALQA